MGTFVLFVCGFYILVKGSRMLVDGAVSLAHLFTIPEWVIGIVIVGIGTSMPEFAINIAAVLKGDMVGISTLIGSNIFNLLVILGIVSVISPPILNPQLVVRDMRITLGVVVVTSCFLLFSVVGTAYTGIVRSEAYILSLIFVGWVLWEIFGSRSGHRMKVEGRELTVGFACMFILIGIIGVVVGGRWVVAGALEVAQMLGIASSAVGLLIVGSGTSVTELAVSITAALKRRSDIAVGNIIGSNIFDFIGIIGMTGLIDKIPFTSDLYLDLGIVLLSTILVYICIVYKKRFSISRTQGASLVLLYIVYFIGVIIRSPFIG